jgi:hypothetical protein
MECKNCDETNKDNDIYECDNCKILGCAKCIKLVCCDCGNFMCKECTDNTRVHCGCYGKCSSCDIDVNRCDNGWPCRECGEWLCGQCRFNSKCKKCNPDDE